MIRINQIKVSVGADRQQIQQKAAELLRVSAKDITNMHIVRQSIDARKKPEIYYTYTIDAEVKNEAAILRRFANKQNMVSLTDSEPYKLPEPGSRKQMNRPVVIGMGPAGLFCAYFLALAGYKPVLYERGKAVEERQADVQRYWETGVLNTASNVQFGEGGAGTFSDGKLNTLVKDKSGRNSLVLETFAKFGAPASICYEAKPHIGTDILSQIVVNMRNEILHLGGEVHFESTITDFIIENETLTAVVVNHEHIVPAEKAVLAIGHSARDTFRILYDKHIDMEAKPFAVGLRVEHPQSMINFSQYGTEDPGELGAAPYKVTAKASNGRGVYSFCMCPGGYVVNASSEEGHLAVNGMSYSGRRGANANSAIIVSVSPDDYPSVHPLAGIAFQRNLEKKAFEAGQGKIPMEYYGDFKSAVTGQENEVFTTEFEAQNKGLCCFADVHSIMPKALNEAFVEGMEQFGRQIKGFNRPDAILSGIESRTSSPVRINRDDFFQSNIRGIYPCGEGAGYAGGITSAAMDGIRVAEAIISEYAPY